MAGACVKAGGGRRLQGELNADWPDGSPPAQRQQSIPERHRLKFQALNGAPRLLILTRFPALLLCKKISAACRWSAHKHKPTFVM